jgi:hypothetical protein
VRVVTAKSTLTTARACECAGEGLRAREQLTTRILRSSLCSQSGLVTLGTLQAWGWSIRRRRVATVSQREDAVAVSGTLEAR